METGNLTTMELVVSGGDWTPTPHGALLTDTLAQHDLVSGKDVLELGGGVGNQTIILLRQGARHVVTTEIRPERSETTRRNVEHNCPGAANVEYRVADWLNTPGNFDVVVTNPPFAKSGKRNQRYFIDSLILDGHRRLRPGGLLIFVQSSMANLAETERQLEVNGFESEVVAKRRGPFRDYYLEDEAFMEEIQHVPNAYEFRDGTYFETLCVLKGLLLPWSPSGA